MDILIRPVRLDDADMIVGILNPIIEAGAYTVLDTPLTAEAERDFITHFPQRGIFHVAECCRDRQVVGLQSLEPCAAYTHAFDHVATVETFVSLSERRQGIGARLAEVTLEAARRQGFEKVLTYVRADNLAAFAFYQKLGFRIVGIAQKQARLNGKYVDEIMIEKFL